LAMRKAVNIGVMQSNVSMRADVMANAEEGARQVCDVGERGCYGGPNRRSCRLCEAMPPGAGTPCLPDVQTELNGCRSELRASFRPVMAPHVFVLKEVFVAPVCFPACFAALKIRPASLLEFVKTRPYN